MGLGNPGRSYAATRHNLGFLAVDRIAGAFGASGWNEKKGALSCQAGSGAARVLFAKPTEFMNLSGPPTASLAAFHKVAPRNVLVLLDDVAIPLGRLRLRAAGSDGGHNGLSSVLESLGTDAVPRLRIGIGPKPERMDLSDFVLARLTRDESEILDGALSRCVETVKLWIEKGIAIAGNVANAKTEEKPTLEDGAGS